MSIFLSLSLSFLYSVILTEYVRMDPGCLSVCVCVCVCLWQLYSLNGWADFDEISHKQSPGHGPVSFFSDFRYLNLMTSSAAILNFRMRHSHGRNFCPILFKFGSDVAKGNPVFGIENQQNRLVTIGFTKNRADDFSRFSPKNCRHNQNCPM